MAATPVLERRPEEKIRTTFRAQNFVDSYEEEEVHNARIRDNYARIINPESKISDIISAAEKQEEVAEVQTQKEVASTVSTRPYLVENARSDSAIFRADNPINKAQTSIGSAKTVKAVEAEEEDEDLRPTPTTIQYQTITRGETKNAMATSGKSKRALTKKEKIVIAIYVCVIVALLALVVINSFIISGLSENIASVQSELTTVRGALAGVNSSIAELVPDSVLDLLIK